MTQFVQNLILGLLIGGTYALLASGLTLIFGVMNVINIAHGAFLILAAFLTWTLWDTTGLDPLLAVVFTTPVMFGVGYGLYVTAVTRVRGMHPSASVLLTFALALVIEGVMGVIWGNTSHSIRPPYVNDSSHLGDVFLPEAQVYGCALATVV